MKWLLPILLAAVVADKPINKVRKFAWKEIDQQRVNVPNGTGRKNATRDEQRQLDPNWLQPRLGF